MLKPKIAVHTPPNNTSKIYFRKNSKYYQIPICDIRYVEVNGDYCISHCGDTQFVNRITLQSMEQLLANRNFYKCHRKYIVNLAFVQNIDLRANKIVLIDNIELPISRNQKKALQDKLELIAKK